MITWPIMQHSVYHRLGYLILSHCFQTVVCLSPSCCISGRFGSSFTPVGWSGTASVKIFKNICPFRVTHQSTCFIFAEHSEFFHKKHTMKYLNDDLYQHCAMNWQQKMPWEHMEIPQLRDVKWWHGPLCSILCITGRDLWSWATAFNCNYRLWCV